MALIRLEVSMGQVVVAGITEPGKELSLPYPCKTSARQVPDDD